jgi:hypothetical protein
MWNRTLSTLFGAALLLALTAPSVRAIPEDHKFLDREAAVEVLTVEDEAALDIAKAELDAEETKLAGLEKIRDDAKVEFDAAEAELNSARMALDLAKDDLDRKEDEAARKDGAYQNAPLGTPPEDLASLKKAAEDAWAAADQAETDVMKAHDRVNAAEPVFNEKKDALAVAQGDVDDQKLVVAAREMVVAGIEEEIERTGTYIEGLSEEQVFAFGRNFNSAIKSGLLPLLITADDLEELGDANKHQINAFARKFIHRARFESHAARVEAEGDLAKAEWFRAKGERMYQKFDAKIDRFDSGDEIAGAEARGAARNAARDAAKSAAQDAAKNAAQGEAKNASKKAAKKAAKAAAKQASQGAAKGKGHSS